MTEIVKIQQQFGEYLFNFIKSRVASTEDAQDIYQEMILKIMNRSGQLNKSGSLKSWLFTIARNQITDYYRSRKIQVDIDSLAQTSFHEDGEESYQSLEGCLSGFIEALPADYRKIIKLSEIEGKTQKEIAASLGINYITLRSRVQRGRKKIKEMIFEACAVEQDTSGGVVDCTPKNTSSACNPDENRCV